MIRSRRHRDHEKRETVCQLFHWFYDEVFQGMPDRRFTLFVLDPLDKRSIIPIVRYSRGHRDLMCEWHSKAQYQRNEGCTGRAWERAEKLIKSDIRPFANRQDFEACYLDELKISKATVQGLSDYMVQVRRIYSYGFLDHKGELLGVVSIDVKDFDHELDQDKAETVVHALGPVLEAFSN